MKTTNQAVSARDVLADDHPYRRALENITVVERQMMALAWFMLVLGVLSRHAFTRALPIQVCGVVVEVLLGLLLIGEITTRRRAARDFFIQQSADGGLVELRDEAHRLRSPKHTRKLAARLARASRDARDLHRIPVASRPPPSAANLAHYERTLTGIASTLERGTAPLRAIALADRLVDGGYTAALYTLPGQQLETEIARIQLLMLLDSPDDQDGRPIAFQMQSGPR